MIKKLIYILIFSPLFITGQNNFFWSHSGKYPCILDSFTVESEAYIGDSVTTPHGLYFKEDGTLMSVIDYTDKEIVQYRLNEAWNLDSLEYIHTENLNDPNGEYLGLYWKPDGTKYYVVNGRTDRIEEYTVSINWLIVGSMTDSLSTGSNFSLQGGICFSENGKKIIVTGWETSDNDSAAFREFELTTAWDLSTATEGDTFIDEINPTTAHYEMRLHKSGTALFFILSDRIYQYSLTPVEVETLEYECLELDSWLDNFSPFGLYIKPDYDVIFVTDTYDDTIKEIKIK